jgi:hypothetical protein
MIVNLKESLELPVPLCKNCELFSGNTFTQLWVTVDGIYPEIACFVKTLSQPIGPKQASYAKWQERTRKDIERGFGVLQSKFRFLVQKVELWSVSDIVSLVNCCILLHNWMVTERIWRNESESNDWYDDSTVSENDGNSESGENVSAGDSGASSAIRGSDSAGDGGLVSASSGDGGLVSASTSAVGASNCGDGTGNVGISGSDDNNKNKNNKRQSDPEDPLFQSVLDRHNQLHRGRELMLVRENLVQDRWKYLYDKPAFYRLQQAIINQLHTNSINF